MPAYLSSPSSVSRSMSDPASCKLMQFSTGEHPKMEEVSM